MKTEKQIEGDVFDIIQKSILSSNITGKVYRKEWRPDNSDKEDIVVKFLSGIDEQVQSGVVVVNIYVPDISFKGYIGKKENTRRIMELQKLANEVLEDLSNTDYLFEKNGTPTSLKAEGIDQHFIYVRLQYRRLSN